MNSYDLSRQFVDFSFENPSKIKPNHYALYFFSIEHCNRLGWKKEFGIPTTMTMEAIGIKSYNTYIKTFNELIEFGFYKIIERSKNQYSSNVIELLNFNKPLDKALDKAFIKHATKQSESTKQSISSIDKQETNKQINKLTIEDRKAEFKNSLRPFLEKYEKSELINFYEYWTEHGEKDRKMRFEKEKSFGLSRRLSTWFKNQKKFEKEKISVKKEKKNAGQLIIEKYGLNKAG